VKSAIALQNTLKISQKRLCGLQWSSGTDTARRYPVYQKCRHGSGCALNSPLFNETDYEPVQARYGWFQSQRSPWQKPQYISPENVE
jgi:hypothetical protein